MNRVLGLIFCAAGLWGQQATIRVYSEFDRLNASGQVIDSLPGRDPLEILSPAVVRNAFTSFHVAVTARPGILYWFAVQTNPPNTFRIRVYKELPARGVLSPVLDELREEPKPEFFLAVMPDAAEHTMTDVYLLDIWTPPDTPVGTVRLEVMVKEAYWAVAPMEVRVLPARVPHLASRVCCDSLPEAGQPGDRFAWAALLTGFAGGPLPPLPAPATVRSVIRRNAIQDAALIRTLTAESRRALFDRVWPLIFERSTPHLLRFRTPAEAYLPIRRLIFNTAAGSKR
ncbi:MAG: hypothetical protein ACRD7E_12485 [Bryobacteraceae bacterium]